MRKKMCAKTALLCFLAFGAGASPAFAVPIYYLGGFIPVPPIASNTTGAFSFDLSFFDANTQLDYVADRPNAAIDVFSAATNSFVTRINGTGANAFVGTVGAPDTGPNGVVVANIPGQHVVYGADGNSTVKAFDLANGNQPLAGSPIVTGTPSQRRADEMAFDPKDKILIVANDRGTPSPFVSLINTTTNTVITTIAFDGTGTTPNATAGIEQSVWNPNTGKFYISIPRIGAVGNPGGIAVVDPLTNAVGFYDLGNFGIAACNPTGLALGVGNQLMIGCSSTASILFDPTANGGTGKVINTFSQATGVDVLAFDPSLNVFALASSANGVSIIDALSATFLQQLTTFPGSHSVAVDPVSNEIFVPVTSASGLLSGIAACVTGCIEVFVTPEPSTLPLMAAGLIALLGVGGLTRRRRESR